MADDFARLERLDTEDICAKQKGVTALIVVMRLSESDVVIQ